MAALLAAIPLPAVAQDPPRANVGAGLGIDLVVGDGSDFLDGGGSRFLFADFRLDGRGAFAIRVDGALGGLEDDEDELTGARAENDLLVVVAGPQVTFVPTGRWRPYAGALVGLAASHWMTEETVLDQELEEDDGEAAFAWGGYAGLGVILDDGDHPVMLRFEARVLQTGELPFARAPAPGGGTTGVIDEDVALLGLRVAFSLGF